MAPKTTILKKYLALKNSLIDIQIELKELRPQVLEILLLAPQNQVDVGRSKICLSTKQRTTFDMKSAKEKIGKILKPFFKTTVYSEINVLDDIDEAA